MPLVLLTTLALFAFAANSVLCRLALGSGAIDPVSFTLIRLLGGALVLLAIFYAMQGKKESGDQQKGSWPSSIALFLYAMSFSLAYLSLSSGTGALILFGSVQVTMLVAALKRGEKLQSHQWLGFGIALGGIAYLVSPGVSAPDWRGALLMSLSGVAWGLYSIAGRAVTSPIAMTMGNFVRAAMIAIVASLFTLPGVELKSEGVGSLRRGDFYFRKREFTVRSGQFLDFRRGGPLVKKEG